MFRRFVVILFLLTLALGALAPTLAQDVIELEAWVAFADHRYDWAVDTAERFNALHDDINVTMVSVVDYDTIVNNYTLGREDGTYPEIVQLFDAALQFAVDSDWFSYAEDIIAGRDEVLGHPVDFDDIIPGHLQLLHGRWRLGFGRLEHINPNHVLQRRIAGTGGHHGIAADLGGHPGCLRRVTDAG